MKAKRMIILAAVVFVVLLAFLIGTGFQKRTDVVLADYALSEDGTVLTFRTALPSSMGYIRGFQNHGGGIKPHYLTFYATFGGLNNSFGAKNTFELPLGPEETEIYFNRPGGGYELVLQKDADGNWVRPTE